MKTLKGLGACGFLIFFISCASSPQEGVLMERKEQAVVESEEQNKEETNKAQNQFQFTRAYYDRF